MDNWLFRDRLLLSLYLMNLSKLLAQQQIEKLNALQQEVLNSFVPAGADLQLLAPTGSGKTLAFLLPLLQVLQKDLKQVQALVIVPTRELALQIEQVFKRFQSGYKVSCCYGGHSVKAETNSLIEAPALLIGTPGRLAYHLREEHIDLGLVKMLVLDEFDKSLSLGFTDDMAYIVSALPHSVQKILTSATTIEQLPTFINLQNPISINFLHQKQLEPQLTFFKVLATPEEKMERLYQLICKLGAEQILIFCNHRESANRVGEMLIDKDLVHDIYHGALAQDARERALAKFKNGSIRILVTTDLAARGLDISDLDSIIHYQLPHTETEFVHRNGRTARMQRKGKAFLFFTKNEQHTYLPQELPAVDLSHNYPHPQDSSWQTLYLSLGKKNKISKADVLGFLIKTGEISKEQVGDIAVKDQGVYVAVWRSLAKSLCGKTNKKKIKGQTVQVSIAL